MDEDQPKTNNTDTNNEEGGVPGAEQATNQGPEVPKPEVVEGSTKEEDPTGRGGTNGNDIDKHKMLAIVGYIVPFLFFVPLVTDAKDNKFARYHANQQLLLLLFWVVGQIVASLLTFIMIGMFLYPLIYIGGIIFMVMGVINALNGEMKPLPVLGKYELIK